MGRGKIVIDVILDDSKAKKGLSDLMGLKNGNSGFLGKMFSGGKKLLGTALAFKAISKGIGMVTDQIGSGISRFDTLEKFPKMMQNFGYTAAESTKSIDKLQNGILGLPTTLDDVVSTAQSLTMMTGDLGKATDLTLALNNAFLASGKSTADVARGMVQYTQMLARGEVDLMSWRTLMETMPVALKQVSEAFGLASNDPYALYDALKDGDITFDQFNEKLLELNSGVNGFAEQALINSKGIATSWQNVKTAMARGIAGLLKSVDKAMIDAGFGSIADNINKLQKPIGAMFSFISNASGKAIEFIGKHADKFVKVFKGVQRGLKQIIPKIEKVMMPFFSYISELGAKFLEPAKKAINNYGKVLLDFFFDLGSVLNDFFKGDFSGGFEKLKTALVNGISGIATTLGDYLITKFNNFKTLLKSIDFGGIAVSILEGIKNAMVFGADIIGGIATNIKDWLFEKTNAQSWADVGSSIISGIKDAIDTSLGILGDIGSDIKGWIFDQFQVTTWGELGSNIISGIKTGIDNSLTFLSNVGTDIKNWIFNSFNVTTWEELGDKIVSGIKKGIINAYHYLSNVGTDIKNWIFNALNATSWTEAGTTIIEKVHSAVKGAVQGLAKTGKAIAEWILKHINLKNVSPSDVWNFATGILNAIADAVNALVYLAITIADAIVTGIVNGFTDSDFDSVGDIIWTGIDTAISEAIDFANFVTQLGSDLATAVANLDFSAVKTALENALNEIIGSLNISWEGWNPFEEIPAPSHPYLGPDGKPKKGGIDTGGYRKSKEVLLPSARMSQGIDMSGFASQLNNAIRQAFEQAKLTALQGSQGIANTMKAELMKLGLVIDPAMQQMKMSFRQGFEQIKLSTMLSMQGLGLQIQQGFMLINPIITQSMTQMQMQVKSGFEQIKMSVGLSMQGIGLQIQQGFMLINPIILTAMQTWLMQFRTGFEQIKLSTSLYMTGILNTMQTGLNLVNPMLVGLMTTWKATFRSNYEQIKSMTTNYMTGVVNSARASLSVMNPTVASIMAQMNAGFSRGYSQAVALTASYMSRVVSTARSFSGGMFSAGYSLGQGFYNGLAAIGGSIIALAYSIASRAAAAMRSALRIHSPSREGTDIGSNLGGSVALGMKREEDNVLKQATRLAQLAIPNISPNFLSGLTSAYGNLSNSNSIQISTPIHIENFNGQDERDIQKLQRELSWHEQQQALGLLGG